MFNRQYGDPNISTLLQLVVNVVCVYKANVFYVLIYYLLLVFYLLLKLRNF